jgi:hypothetical protein
MSRFGIGFSWDFLAVFLAVFQGLPCHATVAGNARLYGLHERAQTG